MQKRKYQPGDVIGVRTVTICLGTRPTEKPTHGKRAKIQWIYQMQCNLCGSLQVREQADLPELAKSKACWSCTPIGKKRAQKIDIPSHHLRYVKIAQRRRPSNEIGLWHLWVHQEWPIVPARDRPEKLFDSECYRAAGCPVDLPSTLTRQAD